MLRRHGYAACGLVALLGLAGCTGGGDDPPVSGSTTSGASTTSSPSTSSTPTTATTSGPAGAYPAAARAHTVEGGKAFVEYYYATLNAVLTSPRQGALAALGDPKCSFCERNNQLVSDMVAGGGRYESSPVDISAIAPMEGGPASQEYYSANFVQSGAWILDGKGKRFQQDKRVERVVSVAVVWKEGRWLLLAAEKA
ncbi:MAG: DUF6318 family protein [Pedococcus sp.]